MKIEFNHLYITLDGETLESIATSEFISQDFCKISRDTVEADGESWTGTYLRGKQSYFELFAPGGAQGLQEGFCGIGFSSQQAGQMSIINEKLLTTRQTESRLRVRKTEAAEIPWFHYLALENPDIEAFAPWLMEFHPDYLDYKGIKPIRAGYFDRAAYMQTLDSSKNCLFDDISEIHLELTASEHQDLALLLQAFGYQSSRSKDITIYGSPYFTLQVTEKVNPIYRIRQVVCLMTAQPNTTKSYTFGDNARLRVGTDTAVWQFGPRHPM